MGINDRCAVGACNNARKYKEKYVIKQHISAFDKGLELRFWKFLTQNCTRNGPSLATESILNLERPM